MGRPAKGKSGVQTKRVQIRLRPEDDQMIDELIAAGYATNRSEVIRRSIEETHKAELFLK